MNELEHLYSEKFYPGAIPEYWIKIMIKSNNSIEEMAIWCINNTESLWSYMSHMDVLYFFFENEDDATLFRLTF